MKSEISDPETPDSEDLDSETSDSCDICTPDRMKSRYALWCNIKIGVREDRCPTDALIHWMEELLDMTRCKHMYPLDKD